MSIELEGLLDSDQAYPAKVDALQAAARDDTTNALTAIRARIARERNPFVLATMASVLGRCGGDADKSFLLPLLDDADRRVVANALESLYRLRVALPLNRLILLLKDGDVRVRANALVLASLADPDRVLQLVERLIAHPDPTVRSAVAHLLGELSARDQATRLLVRMLAIEQSVPILKHLAVGLKKHITLENVNDHLGEVASLGDQCTGAKLALLKASVQEIATELGIVREVVEDLARHHRETQASRLIAGGAAPQPPDSPDPAFPVSAVYTRLARKMRALASSITRRSEAGALASTQERPPTPPAAPVGPADFSTPPSHPPAVASEADGRVSLSRIAALAPQDDDDVPLSFSAAWGLPGELDQSRPRISRPLSIRTTAPPPPDVGGSPGGSWRLAAGAMAMLAVCAGIAHGLSAMTTPRTATVSSGTIEPQRPGPSGSGNANRTSKSAPPSMTPSTAVPASTEGLLHLGPEGAPVTVQGTVVGTVSGHALVRAGRRNYLILGNERGRVLDSGMKFSTRGVIAGVSANGLVYVKAGPS